MVDKYMPKVVPITAQKGDKKYSYSTFFVTINTNDRNYDRSKLISALTQIFGDDTMFYALLRGDTTKIDKDWATVQFSAEKGPKSGYMHSHILIKLRHNTKVQFNIEILRKVLERELKLGGVHIDVKGYGNSDKTLEQYISDQ